jgi:hypothetical protein
MNVANTLTARRDMSQKIRVPTPRRSAHLLPLAPGETEADMLNEPPRLKVPPLADPLPVAAPLPPPVAAPVVVDSPDEFDPAPPATRPRILVPPPAPTTRPRFVGPEADELTKSAETIQYHQNRPLEKMGKGRSFLLMALSKLGEGMERAQANANAQGRPVGWGDVLSGATYGLGAGAAAAFDNTAVDRMRRAGEVAGEQQYYGQEFQRQKQLAQVADERAGTDLKKAQTAYALQRPDSDAEKRAATERQRERTMIGSNLRSLKGQKLDPTNPRHASWLDRAERAGWFIDPDEWNNSASNQVAITVVDPENPEQTRQAFFNKVTGESTDAGQKGYAQPVKKSGMTEAQERADADRDAGRAATAERFERMFGLGVERFNSQIERDLRGHALKAFRVETTGEMQRARAIEREITDIKRRVGEGSARAGEMDRVPVLEAEGAQIAERIEAAKARALAAPAASRSIKVPSPRSAAAAPVTEATIRERARVRGKNPDAAVAAARSAGIIK